MDILPSSVALLRPIKIHLLLVHFKGPIGVFKKLQYFDRYPYENIETSNNTRNSSCLINQIMQRFCRIG